MSKRKWTREEIAEYRKENGSIFYYNSEDSNILVPKVYGYGLSFNWANPISWLTIAAVVLLFVFRKFFW